MWTSTKKKITDHAASFVHGLLVGSDVDGCGHRRARVQRWNWSKTRFQENEIQSLSKKKKTKNTLEVWLTAIRSNHLSYSSIFGLVLFQRYIHQNVGVAERSARSVWLHCHVFQWLNCWVGSVGVTTEVLSSREKVICPGRIRIFVSRHCTAIDISVQLTASARSSHILSLDWILSGVSVTASVRSSPHRADDFLFKHQ